MEETIDINRELMLDANATAGLLYEIFGVEMTAAPTECEGSQRYAGVVKLLFQGREGCDNRRCSP